MRAKLFVILGIALLTAAAVQAVAVPRYLRDTSVTIGEVMATPYGGSHPVIRFATADGVVVTFPGNGWIGGYATGDRIAVRYDPRRPRISPAIDAIGSVWAGVIASVVLGVGFVLGGWLSRRR